MTNLELWNGVFKTDPKAVKQITGKQYQGNSPKPYWIIQRATETFGACGTGWGLIVVNERFERLSDNDVLHVALVRVWYVYKDVRGEIEQMGQTKACYMTNNGKLMVDEDAPKKSVTDGMIKCLSMLGFAGDIFSGRWDDSKYVADLNEEFRDKDKSVEPTKEETAAITYKMVCEANEEIILRIKQGIFANNLEDAASAWDSMDEETKLILWKAPTKGGCFSTIEREVMKSTAFREAHFGKGAAA